jgi:chemotaxis signal transduction protein
MDNTTIQPSPLIDVLFCRQQAGHLIIPQMAIAEIIDRAVKADFEDSPFLVGKTSWQSESLIVLSSAALLSGTKPIKNSAQKILVMHKLYTQGTSKFYGIAIENTPKMLKFGEEAFSNDQNDEREGIVYQTQVDNETAFILDLEFIEQTVENSLSQENALNAT